MIVENMRGAKMYEIVRIGWSSLIGEIIRLDGSNAYVQCYENTGGLCIGDPVIKTNKPLSVELGPGIVESIFDGIQRPLTRIHTATGEVFIPKGFTINALDREKTYQWTPDDNIKVGQLLSGGDIFGVMYENDLVKKHYIMVPPNDKGIVTHITGAGIFNIEQTLLKLEFNGAEKELCAYHYWHVREPRPVIEKIKSNTLLRTGQRVLDSLFPSVQGGTCAIPGAFGCGKTCISQAVSKYSNSDIVVYVGCGERGNEMAEILTEFPELKLINDHEEVSVMLRTVLIANTSNMPVAAREASIYTGITIAEYFRDMGYHVSMLADSTSRWAEALREISGRLSEMPADSGYPAYLGGRLANFYERAGKVSCLGSPEREGSISIIGAVSPPGGDFGDPVTVSTMNIVQVFWGLDKKLAQKKHFPSINWNRSYSNYLEHLSSYFTEFDENFLENRKKIVELLQKEYELQEIVQLVGKDAIGDDQKLVLEVARLIREEFLQQNAFSDYDYYCPLQKTACLMKVIIHFYNASLQNMQECSKDSTKLTFGLIKNNLKNALNSIVAMKLMSPTEPDQAFINKANGIIADIDNEFRVLNEK